MLTKKKVIRNALAHAAEIEGQNLHAAWAASNAARSWYLVQISGAAVRRTRDLLQQHGYESYYPLTLKAHPVPRKRLSHKQRRSSFVFREFRSEPLFRNYLFVFVDLRSDHWHAPFRDAGAYGIACTGDLPYAISPAEIERWRQMEVEGAIPGKTTIEELFKIGDPVRMCSGAFAGLTGSIDQVDESGRVRILLSLFGRPTPVLPEFSEFERVGD
jgi:transcriptional antiterminator NusG